MSPLSPPPARRWPSLALRIVLTGAIIALLVLVNARYLFHSELYESGDTGADSLSVLRAARGQELYGSSSRWEFRHPGPALFYAQAWGETVFYRWLHLTPTPYNAQVLVVIGLVASLFAAGISVAARWVRDGTFVALALALAALHCTAVDGRFMLVSTWPAYVSPLIFFCLVAAVASVGAGQGEDLPLLALAGGFLLHLHVAQPLFVGPMLLLGYAGLWWACWRRSAAAPVPAVSLVKEGDAAPPPTASPASPGLASALPWRRYRRSHRLAVLIAFVFAVPILVDLLFPNGNFQQILAHLRRHKGEPRPLLTSLAYLLRFAAYKPSLPGAENHFAEAVTPQTLLLFVRQHLPVMLLWVGALLSPLLPLSARLWRGKEPVLLGDASVPTVAAAEYAAPAGRWRFLGWLWAAWALSIGLTLFWGTVQGGVMYYFNAWFNYSLWYVLALFAAGAVADAFAVLTFRSERRVLWKTVVILLCAVTAGATLLRHPERFRADDAANDADRLQQRSVADRLSTEPAGTPRAKLLFFPHDGWGSATGIAVLLTRTGRPAYVLPNWEFAFGADHQVPDWENVLSKPADTNPTFEIWHLLPKKRVSGEDARFPLSSGYTLVPGGLPIDPAGVPSIVWQGEGANALDYIGGAWEDTDNETTERLAMIQFRPRPVPPTAGVRITFDFTVAPFRKREGPQRLEIRFNGNDLGTLTFAPDATAPQSVVVPAAAWNRYGSVLLTMNFPDALAPAVTGDGSAPHPHAFEARRITFALETEAAVPMPPPTMPPPVPAPTASPAPTPDQTPVVSPAAEPSPARPDLPGKAPPPSPAPETMVPPDQMPTGDPTPTPPIDLPTDPGNGEGKSSGSSKGQVDRSAATDL